MSIVLNLIDQDLNNFLTSQLVMHQRPELNVSYSIICQDKDINLAQYSEFIKKGINGLLTQKFLFSDLDYLKSLGYFKEDFLDFLLNISFNDVTTVETIDPKDNYYEIEVFGKWEKVLLIKDLIRNVMSQSFYYHEESSVKLSINERINKIKDFHEGTFRFYDGATKYRSSSLHQQLFLQKLQKEVGPQFLGSTNIFMCQKLNLRPFATFGNDLIMSYEPHTSVKISLARALQAWLREYDNKFLISPVDTFGVKRFIDSFDCYDAVKMESYPDIYSGVKWEGQDATTFTQEIIKFYETNKIKAEDKLIIYADNISFEQANYLHRTFKNKINTLFEIGEDCAFNNCYPKVNLKCEMSSIGDFPTFRRSDDAAKTFCKSDVTLAKIVASQTVNA